MERVVTKVDMLTGVLFLVLELGGDLGLEGREFCFVTFGYGLSDALGGSVDVYVVAVSVVAVK